MGLNSNQRVEFCEGHCAEDPEPMPLGKLDSSDSNDINRLQEWSRGEPIIRSVLPPCPFRVRSWRIQIVRMQDSGTCRKALKRCFVPLRLAIADSGPTLQAFWREPLPEEPHRRLHCFLTFASRLEQATSLDCLPAAPMDGNGSSAPEQISVVANHVEGSLPTSLLTGLPGR